MEMQTKKTIGWSRKIIFNNLTQKWLDDNYILMFSAVDEVKSIAAERFRKTLKEKSIKNNS